MSYAHVLGQRSGQYMSCPMWGRGTGQCLISDLGSFYKYLQNATKKRSHLLTKKKKKKKTLAYHQQSYK